MLLSKSTFRAAACAAAFLFAPSIASAQSPFGGFYFGGHAGYGELMDADELNGFVGGVHAGYNYQAGSFVIGAEVDYAGTTLEETYTDVDFGLRETISFPYLASIRGRVGFTSSSAFFFATAGYSWSEIEYKISDGTDSITVSADMDGAVAGLGIEYKFSNALSARVEGLHYWLSSSSAGETLDIDTGVVRAGLSYHLN